MKQIATGLNAFERETVTNANDADDTVLIWTAQRKVIGAMRRRPSAREIASGHVGSTEWAQFEVRADLFKPWLAVRAEPTSEQRANAAERARKAFGWAGVV